MKKKILSLLLAFCVLLPCALMLNACAQDPYAKYLQFYFTNDEPAVYQLKEEYLNSEDLAGKNFVIPSTYKGKPLKIIDPSAFKGSNIGGVVIPNSVYQIGSSAFENCTELQSVSLPNSLQELGQDAFENTALEYVVIPSSLKRLANDAFDDDTKLYYNGTATQFAEIQSMNWAYQGAYEPDENEKWYFYSDNITDLSSYIGEETVAKGLWTYNENQEIESVSIEYTNTVSGKSYGYTNSVVELSDAYWDMLLQAKAQGQLEFVLEPAQVALFNESANKEEFASKMATLNATNLQGMKAVFADGKVTLWQGETQYSMPFDYAEVGGSIYAKVQGNAYSLLYKIEDGKLVETLATEYSSVKHYYELVA